MSQPAATGSGTNRPVVLAEDEIAALFRVLWYVQRIDALYQSLRFPCGQDTSVAFRRFSLSRSALPWKPGRATSTLTWKTPNPVRSW